MQKGNFKIQFYTRDDSIHERIKKVAEIVKKRFPSSLELVPTPDGFFVEIRDLTTVHSMYNQSIVEYEKNPPQNGSIEWDVSIQSYPKNLNPDAFFRIVFISEILFGYEFSINLRLNKKRRIEWNCFLMLNASGNHHLNPHDSDYWNVMNACAA